MSDSLSKVQIMHLVHQVEKELSNDINLLTDLDAVAGDGDLGVTVELGMRAVTEGFNSMPDVDIGTLLTKSGLNFNRAASSTFGTICATALMRAGKVAAGKNKVDTKDIVEMIEASESGIRERGKAKPGDKTVLDALVPMREAFSNAIQSGLDLERSFDLAIEAAQEGVEKTKIMVPSKGRAKWISERAIGHPDPGAMALLLMLNAFIKHLKNIDNPESK